MTDLLGMTDIVSSILSSPEVVAIITGLLGTNVVTFFTTVKEYMDKLGILKFFDYNSDVEAAPASVRKAEKQGMCLISFGKDTVDRIMSTCANATEAQSVRLAIAAAESSGQYTNTIYTTYAVYTLEQGFITNISRINGTTSGLASVNADGIKIGASKFVSGNIDGKVLSENMSVSGSEICGKVVTSSWKGTDYGNVIIGTFWDGQCVGKSAATVDSIGEEIFANGRLLQYLENFTAGEHVLEFRTGYYGGHDDVKGDYVVWNSANTVKYVIKTV